MNSRPRLSSGSKSSQVSEGAEGRRHPDQGRTSNQGRADGQSLFQRHRGLVVFFVCYYVALAAYGFARGNEQTIFYVLFIGAGAALVLRLDNRFELRALVLWGLAAWGCAHMVGGLLEIGGEVVYEHSLGAGQLRFDKVVHFFGFGFATLAAYEIVGESVGPGTPARTVATIAFFIGLGIGAINETIEFLITLLPAESNVGGFSNTGWDLVANTLGAATAALLAPQLLKSPPATGSKDSVS